MKGNLEESLLYITSECSHTADVGIVLGSGLNAIVNEMDVKCTLSYDDIPHFYLSSVKGHKGNIAYATVNGKKVLAFQGRLHLYEGFSADEVTFYVHLLNLLGVKKLIITNAAGAVNENYRVGDIMIVEDHINLTGVSPLMNDVVKPSKRFVNMSRPYATEVFDRIDLSPYSIHRGVFAQLIGPCYETDAEVKMLRMLGADAVSMSSVIEAIVARYYDMSTICLSMITNEVSDGKDITHENVVVNAKKHQATFLKLLLEVIKAF
jgi:purine-nucleoside phosphorylase